MSLNKVMLIGNLGKDPEVRTFEGGRSVCNMRLATTESYLDKASGQKKETTSWHNIVVWGRLVEVCEKYLKKGSQIYVEGKLNYREWTNEQGVQQRTTDINAQKIEFLSKRESAVSENQQEDHSDLDFLDGDLPF